MRRMSRLEQAAAAEDPLIPFVHLFDRSCCAAAPHPLQFQYNSTSATSDKENQIPLHPNSNNSSHTDTDTEIEQIESEIQRLSSRLHQLKAAQQESNASTSAADGKRSCVVPAKSTKHGNTIKNKNSKEEEVEVGRGLHRTELTLGPLDSITKSAPKRNLAALHNTQQQPKTRNGDPRPAAAAIMPRRRRGVSLGPSEIHHNLQLRTSESPLLVATQSSLHAIEEAEAEAEHASNSKQGGILSRSSKTSATKPLPQSRKPPEPMKTAKNPDVKDRATKGDMARRSTSMSPRTRRHSIAKVSNLRGGGGIAAVGAKKAAEREERAAAAAAAETPETKGACIGSKNVAPGRRSSLGRAKVRFVASRYSLSPATARDMGLGDELVDRKLRNCVGAASDSGGSMKQCTESQEEEEVNAKLVVVDDASSRTDARSPQSINQVAELLPRIKTLLPCSAESPRDSGCAKRVADLVGRKSVFGTVARGDVISSYQVRSLEDEAPEATAAAAEIWV